MWWFYTVILGMAFGQVLQELAITMRDWRNETRRPFAPAMLWQVFLLALIVQVWLAVTYYRDTVTEITILELLAFLAVPAGILVMSFLLPDSNHDPGHDAAVAFSRIRPVFFGALIAMVAVNVLHGLAIGDFGLDLDLLFQCAIVAGAITGLFLHSTTADIVLAVVMIGVVATYIGVGYSTVAVDGTG